MGTEGEKRGRLRDFLMESFRPSELEVFLELKGFEDVAKSLNPDVGGSRYFFDVVRALAQRGLVDARFFDVLTKERSAKAEQIQGLKEFWLEDERRGPPPLGSTTPRSARADPSASA